MSRIGKIVIIIPENIHTKVEENIITIEGPKGTLSYKLSNVIKITSNNNTLRLTRTDDSQLSKKIYGLSRTIINNMIIGISQGFTKKLEIEGVGYRSQMEKKNLVLNVGFSHPVIIKPPLDITIEVENNTTIKIIGINKETVGHIAAKIRSVRPPEPYKGKGIRYSKEIIRKKVGKAGK